MAKVRIQKALSDAGVLSRRKAEEYIRMGRITVNGHKAQPGHPVDTRTDRVAIDGHPVAFPRRKEPVYIMLNKPRGYVTTTSDELGRKCVAELVEDVGTRVYPIGRLDRDSEGLLLLTNDGQFANLIMHPSHRVGKTYRVTVRPGITDEQAAHLGSGVDLGGGEKSGPATVLVLEKEQGRVVLQITISEGKNREIRRMCEGVGLEVGRLKRISVGPVKLGMLQPGQWRPLKKSEVIALRNAARPASEHEPIPKDDPTEKTGSFGKAAPRGDSRTQRGRGQKNDGRRGGAKSGGPKGSASKYAGPKTGKGRSGPPRGEEAVSYGKSTRPAKKPKPYQGGKG